MSKKIAVAALVIILVLVNWFIHDKEKHLAEGRIVYLELAPVDPRSLMQGDYMDLRFEMARKLLNALPRTKKGREQPDEAAAEDGLVVVRLDKRNIGSFRALYKDQPLSENEIIMRYRVRSKRVRFATNAFFFQEGHAKYYEPARYGCFRVDDDGDLLLTGLYDENLDKLGPPEPQKS
ncbi:MAG: GDYXXLXY domain-containing protein [Desulfobacteraceae bacterium]|nr:GDYXXLXY domain-containing protein [Desulfobacteraceae bacterium]